MWAVLLCCSLLPNLGVTAVASVQTGQIEKHKKTFQSLAAALGIKVDGACQATPRQSGGTDIVWGHTMGFLDAEGRVRAIGALSESQSQGIGKPRYRAELEVIALVKRVLGKAGVHSREPFSVEPKAPWKESDVQLTVLNCAEAFGKPTVGFAGGPQLTVNRYSGQISMYLWSPELTPVRPIVNVDHQRALKIADSLLKKVEGPGRTFTHRASLQYYRPSRDATPFGQALLKRAELPYCWVVTAWFGSGKNLRSPLTSVVLDANTCQVIEDPSHRGSGRQHRSVRA